MRTRTYPTTYIAYHPAALSGGLPTSTTFFAKPTCKGVVDEIPLATVEYSAFVAPQTDSFNGSVYTLPTQLVSYLKGLPEITSVYSTHDIATCTTTVSKFNPGVPHNVPQELHTTFQQPFPDDGGVTKTSVLVLTTSTGNAVIHTVNSPIALGVKAGGATPTPVTPAPVTPPSNPGSGKPPSNPGPGNPPSNPGSGNAPVVPPAGNNPVVPIAGSPSGANNLGGAIASLLNPAGSPGAKAAGSTGSPTAVGNAIISAIAAANSGAAGAAGAGGSGTKPLPAGITPPPSFPPALTFSGQTITANSVGAFVVAGTTLTPGGPAATISGSTISIGKSGSGSTIAVINGVTSTLSGATPAGAGFLTIGGTTFAPSVVSGSTFYVVDGTTLGVGQVATVNGTTLSLASDGATLVINGQTSYVPKTTGVQMFTGAGVRTVAGKAMWTGVGLVAVGCGFSWLL
jgi:hypothetical protein